MKAALATRPQSEMQARYGALMQKAQNATNPKVYAQVQIFNGFMLDTRVSITYFCMMGLFIYFIVSLPI
jgi:hypothetical protein